MKPRLCPIVVFVAVILPFLFVRPSADRRGTDLPYELHRIQKIRPAMVCIGSSHLATSTDIGDLSNRLGCRVERIWRGGAASACYYLIVKNVICSSTAPPRSVAVFFMDSYLTLPTYRVDGMHKDTKIDPLSLPEEPLLDEFAYPGRKAQLGYYLERLWPLYARREETKEILLHRIQSGTLRLISRGHPEEWAAERYLEKTFANAEMDTGMLNQIELAEEDLTALPPHPFEFHSWIDRSFLPALVQMTQERGVRLILVRMKRRARAIGIPEPEDLRRYVADLRAYLAGHGVPLVDFSYDPAIRLEYYSEGDHVCRQEIFTPLLADALKPLLPAHTEGSTADEPQRR